ncbi:hypothetical protein BgiMline_033779, partial [Biomphalaria glabrata]
TMGLPGGFSVLHCVGTVLLGIGVILQIVGLSTPSWMSFTALTETDYERIWMGLWSICNELGQCKVVYTKF